MRKNIFKLLNAVLVLIVLVSCEKEYVAPVEFADATFTNGGVPLGSIPVVNVGEAYTFRDASQGNLSTTWFIEEGNFFLNKGFDPPGDSNLYLFIRDDVKTTMEKEQTVFVMFNKPGINKVTLQGVYDQPVEWYGASDTIYSVENNNGKHVFTKVFNVDVYDKIKPAFKVYKDDIEVINVNAEDDIMLKDTNSWMNLTVEAGSKVDFVDLTTVGRPANRSWYFKGGNKGSSGDSVASVLYYSLGRYRAGSLVPGRGWPLPEGSTAKDIPLFINVIQSTLPFEVASTPYELETEDIAINVSGEMNSIIGEEGNFVLHVSNGDFTKEISVLTAIVNPDNRTQIILKPAEALYNTDVVEVEYKGGNIVSVDERVLQPFNNVLVKMFVDQSLNYYTTGHYSFEIEGGNVARGGADGWWPHVENAFFRQDVYKYDGNWAWHFDVNLDDFDPNQQFRAEISAAGLIGSTVPVGTYEFSVKLFVENSDMSKIRYVRVPSWESYDLPIDLDKTGEWQTLSVIVEFTEPHEMSNIVFQTEYSASETGDQSIYIDDLKMIPLEARPVE